MSDPTPIYITVALAGATLAGWLTLRRPLAAFGVLFLLASLTLPTVETPIGTMRLEQPAIAVVGVILLVTGRLRLLASLPRWAWAMAAFLAVYLGVLATSSALVAPDPTASLRMVVWWALSMAGGVIAVVLVGGRGREAILPLGLVGAAVATIGLVIAFAFRVAGPTFDLGIQGADTILPRVYGIAREPNLYASFLATCLPFGLELARSARHRRLGVAVAALILLAIPLGVTRGAFLGLVAGGVVYLGTLAWRDGRRPLPLVALASSVVLATVVGIGAAEFLLPDPLERLGPSVGAGPVWPGDSGAAGATSRPGAGEPATPRPSLRPQPDTVAFRMERVPVAMTDLRQSPIIGLGAESFGQRHEDPSTAGPDHLAILVVADPYESGLIGSVALTGAFVILVLALWQASYQPLALGSAAAYLASAATLLAAYQATNALHFAGNWLIIGAAVALAARPSDSYVPTGTDWLPAMPESPPSPESLSRTSASTVADV